MNSDWWIYFIGFGAQILFFLRTFIQWFASERKGEVVSPVIFWQISLIGSLLLLFYGILRDDFSIILGQILVYYIYVRNLQLQSAWKKFPLLFRSFALFTPLAILLWFVGVDRFFLTDLFQKERIASLLLLWGSIGQVIFTFRFIFQWIYSEKKKQSSLPATFWGISLLGSAMILSYGILRKDPVLIAGQIFGFFTYSRNLMLSFGRKNEKFSALTKKITNHMNQKKQLW